MKKIYSDEATQKEINKLTETFHKALFKDDEAAKRALDYVLNRNLDTALIEKFKIGWYPPDRYTMFCDKNLRGRVIYPIIDEHGDTVGFSGRTLVKDEEPKYCNDRFSKNSFVYGLNLAWRHALLEDSIIIVEGFHDVIALHKIGVFNVVSIMGTNLSIEVMIRLTRFTNRFYLLLDGDKAGREATQAILERHMIGRRSEDKNDFIDLGNSEYYNDDPDTFINKFGKKAFNFLMENAKKKKKTQNKKEQPVIG